MMLCKLIYGMSRSMKTVQRSLMCMMLCKLIIWNVIKTVRNSLSSRRVLEVEWDLGICVIWIWGGHALTMHWSISAGVGCFSSDVVIDISQVYFL